VTVSWKKHDLTDITGARTETGISGYQLYRDGREIVPLLTGTTYVDTNGIEPLQSYRYTLIAVDESGNRSPASDPLLVTIQPPIEVFQAYNPAAVGGTTAKPVYELAIVTAMLHGAIRQLTGRTTTAAAWESLFPKLAANTLIGIKINTLSGAGISTKPAVVDAIVDGLTQMLGATFPAYNIIVFDDRGKDTHMKPAGFVLRDDQVNYRIASANWNTTLHNVPVTTAETDAQKWGTTLDVKGFPQKLSTIVEAVDYLINVPVLKDHNLSGITFSMKNFYGIIHNPQGLHRNMCSPFIPELYNTEVNGAKLKDKVRLIVGDALSGCYQGGPAGPFMTMTPCTLVIGTDPVAMDTWALRRINKERAAHNLSQISFDSTGNARHILAASQAPYNLGSTNYVIKEVAL
jgi:hypothetical protein